MAKKFDKDKFIRVMLARKYLIAQEDGTILRANKADPVTGIVDWDRGHSVVTQQTHKPTGRVYFNVTYMGITKSVLTNRVVAWAYHPNPENLPQVNHLDGIKAHNGKDNLEWSTGSDNEKHAHRTGLKSGRGSANSNAKLDAFDVGEIRDSRLTVKELMKRYSVSRSTITNIQKGRTWQHI